MKIEQRIFSPREGWRIHRSAASAIRPQLVLIFGGRLLLADVGIPEHLRRTYPGARLVFASTSGEITGTTISNEEIAVTAIELEKSSIALATVGVRSLFDSRPAGQELASRLNAPDLALAFVLSDGQLVNGTDLARGFNERLRPGVVLTGGLAGDGARFEKTMVGLDQAPESGRIVAIGFYGKHLQVGFGSSGGWEPEGEEHTATRVHGNIMFELDGKPALKVYREHLREEAAGLPASGLRFPFCITPEEGGPSVVRSVLSIDDLTQSLVFAGDIPAGSRIRFMHASHGDLVAGASTAASQSLLGGSPELAICVSCVGRRIVMGEQSADELQSVQNVLGSSAVLTGFYSYGELAPVDIRTGCQLHNQTMTITTLRED